MTARTNYESAQYPRTTDNSHQASALARWSLILGLIGLALGIMTLFTVALGATLIWLAFLPIVAAAAWMGLSPFLGGLAIIFSGVRLSRRFDSRTRQVAAWGLASGCVVVAGFLVAAVLLGLLIVTGTDSY